MRLTERGKTAVSIFIMVAFMVAICVTGYITA